MLTFVVLQKTTPPPRKKHRLDVNSHVGEFWFIIDALWVSKWVNFVMGKGQPPGPISNNNLFNHYSAARRDCELQVGFIFVCTRRRRRRMLLLLFFRQPQNGCWW